MGKINVPSLQLDFMQTRKSNFRNLSFWYCDICWFSFSPYGCQIICFLAKGDEKLYWIVKIGKLGALNMHCTKVKRGKRAKVKFTSILILTSIGFLKIFDEGCDCTWRLWSELLKIVKVLLCSVKKVWIKFNGWRPCLINRQNKDFQKFISKGSSKCKSLLKFLKFIFARYLIIWNYCELKFFNCMKFIHPLFHKTPQIF